MLKGCLGVPANENDALEDAYRMEDGDRDLPLSIRLRESSRDSVLAN
jgi:hypothetical protein